ncbi:hypothetical protein [Actinomadura macrotermitis]|uniref:Uncharacterized protein n=1 Tax=Actinomadura macrotermitis TaxID=2585200 RepID=A0A7K0C1A5_9ACTN|nr:hypothetical protein [Actinomadura macrotermitis]MQY07248.1 hypothetical protein [Actinomadura macrotermitis]
MSKISNDNTTQSLMEHAAALLGWPGILAEVDLLGCHLWVAARLTEAGQSRLQGEQRPVTDPLSLRFALATDTAFAKASAPVQIDGALSARRTWRGALAPLGGFVAFGARMAIVPPSQARSSHLQMLALVEGFGVIAHHPQPDPPASQTHDGQGNGWTRDGSGGWLQLVHPPDQRPTGRATWVHRLVEEQIFQALLVSQQTVTASRDASVSTPSSTL